MKEECYELGGDLLLAGDLAYRANLAVGKAQWGDAIAGFARATGVLELMVKDKVITQEEMTPIAKELRFAFDLCYAEAMQDSKGIKFRDADIPTAPCISIWRMALDKACKCETGQEPLPPKRPRAWTLTPVYGEMEEEED